MRLIGKDLMYRRNRATTVHSNSLHPKRSIVSYIWYDFSMIHNNHFVTHLIIGIPTDGARYLLYRFCVCFHHQFSEKDEKKKMKSKVNKILNPKDLSLAFPASLFILAKKKKKNFIALPLPNTMKCWFKSKIYSRKSDLQAHFHFFTVCYELEYSNFTEYEKYFELKFIRIRKLAPRTFSRFIHALYNRVVNIRVSCKIQIWRQYYVPASLSENRSEWKCSHIFSNNLWYSCGLLESTRRVNKMFQMDMTKKKKKLKNLKLKYSHWF